MKGLQARGSFSAPWTVIDTNFLIVPISTNLSEFIFIYVVKKKADPIGSQARSELHSMGIKDMGELLWLGRPTTTDKPRAGRAPTLPLPHSAAGAVRAVMEAFGKAMTPSLPQKKPALQTHPRPPTH